MNMAWAPIFVTSLLLAHDAPPPVQSFSVRVETQPTVRNVSRIGVNLGVWTTWGAEQLMRNVVMNPGFEGRIDRTLIVVRRVEGTRFYDHDRGAVHPAGFWRGATYDVRTGLSAGRTGRVTDSGSDPRDGTPVFHTAEPLPELNAGDVVAVTLISDKDLPSHWRVPSSDEGLVSVAIGERRPGSPGVRAVALTRMRGQGGTIVADLDMIAHQAGKCLPVQGSWRLAFWTRGVGRHVRVLVRFRRHGSAPFKEMTIEPKGVWTRHVLNFEASDEGPAQSLELMFRAVGADGKVLLDDVELGARGIEQSGFRSEVVTALMQLRPGVLRDWQDQLGDTLDNRLAGPFARRATRYRPGGEAHLNFHYGLVEFLDLCRQLKATPWIILPTTWSDEEWERAGRFLAQRVKSDGFAEIIVEFGNENWNAIYRPASFPQTASHGDAAGRAVRLMRASAGLDSPIHFVVNGQHANPDAALAVMHAAPEADGLAIAPYFMHRVEAGLSLAARLHALFASDDGRLVRIAEETRRAGKELVVSEVNVHATEGSASPAERLGVTAGAVAGSALGKRLLEGLAAGVRWQNVWVFAGYEAVANEGASRVPLWGIIRDLGVTPRWRPTGLAVLLLNEAMSGDFHAVRGDRQSKGPQMTMAAFHSPRGWAVIAVSSESTTVRAVVHLPELPAARLPDSLLVLDADGPEATNEERERVSLRVTALKSETASVEIIVPPYGMVVALPTGGRT